MTSFVLEVVCILKHSQISVINDTEWILLELKALKKKAFDYYRDYIAGFAIVNEKHGITIQMPVTGGRHAIWARGAAYEKLVVFKALRDLIKYADIQSVQFPKHKRNDDTLFFIRMSAYAIVNGRKFKYTFDIRQSPQGRYYYDHNVGIKKSP